MSEHHDVNYKKIYFTLLGLLVVSVIGPEFGILWVTLVTAFGVAIVKAYLVIENFMHLRWEKKLMKWMLTSSLAVMALMFVGISPDVMKHEGRNWVNEAAIAAVDRGIGGAAEEEPTAVAEAEAEPGEFSAASTFNQACAACHGQAGDGNGPAGASLDPAPADFTDPEFWAAEDRDEERILTVIRDGAAAVGGSPLMVAWGNSYNEEQLQALTDYVMEFQPEQ
ncbi:MAG: c-type cytochrome [Gemmatimonadota bacterium]|nr:c-type cytochrome [Gemmatimonadota bacterium]